MDQLFTNSYFLNFVRTPRFRFILRGGGKKDRYLLSSPHIPIAAVAANRLIITVINITLLLN